MLQTARHHRRRSGQDGFTLIELLVVVIIIGILAAIAIPVYLHQRQKATDAALKSDLHNAAIALASYAADNPDATSAPTQAALASYGLQISLGDTLTATGSPSAGWCIKGNDASGSAPAGTSAYWYDSNAGGLQPQPSATPPGATAAAACYPANVSASTPQTYTGPSGGGGGTPPPAPPTLSGSFSPGSCSLWWTAVAGANGYEVRSDYNSGQTYNVPTTSVTFTEGSGPSYWCEASSTEKFTVEAIGAGWNSADHGTGVSNTVTLYIS